MGPSYPSAQLGEPAWEAEAEAGPLCAMVFPPDLFSPLPLAGPSHLAVSGSAHSCGVPGEEMAGAPPGPRLQPLSPSMSEERLGRHIYALCIPSLPNVPPAPTPFPPDQIQAFVVEGFGPSSLTLSTPPSLLPPPASLGFSFDTNL